MMILQTGFSRTLFSTVIGLFTLSRALLASGLPTGANVKAIDLRAELRRYDTAPGSPATRAQRARLSYYLGKAGELSSDERRALFEKGIAEALLALKESPAHPAALFWWGANAGAVAESEKNLAALGTIREIRDRLLELKKIDPDYGYAAWARTLGVLYHQAPGFISIGSNRRAEECLREAARRFPEFPGNRLSLADFLWDTDRREEARSLALKVKESPGLVDGDFGDFTPDRSSWDAILTRVLAGDKESRR